MSRIGVLLLAVVTAACSVPAAAAEPVLVQCGREYQAAKAAGTLNGMEWGQYRVDCAARLKTPVAAPGPATALAAPAASVPAAPAPAVMPPGAALSQPSGGMAAMHQRQKQCGAEWTAQKASLVTRTPGLTWPRYWSLCNTRLKAAGR